jgi:hypothetical protein
MRLTMIAALSAVALPTLVMAGVASTALASPVVIVQAADYSDAQLQAFSDAMTQVRAASPTDGSAPNADQQAAMAAAVEASGMTIDQFNALATAVSGSPLLQARLAVLATPESAPGSVGAGVTDAELGQFATAMVGVRAAAPTDGTAPNTDQQAAMASAVTATGLALDRFNVIATVVSSDPRLRARLVLIDLQNGG